ncbi:MAG: hypothetical protein PVJ57_14640 [Phycisphaerae bacterium]|jgi:hypothetical protein
MDERAPIAPPTLVSLLICDQVIDDKITSKKSAIGLFNAILVPKMPATINQMVVLASLTEIESRIELELRLVRDADNQVLFHTHGPIAAPSPLAIVDLVFTMRGTRITAPGQYAFEVLCASELLGRRRFQVIQRPNAPEGGAEPEA